jgi:hypothetical protein
MKSDHIIEAMHHTAQELANGGNSWDCRFAGHIRTIIARAKRHEAAEEKANGEPEINRLQRLVANQRDLLVKFCELPVSMPHGIQQLCHLQSHTAQFLQDNH